jgi:hypothetical protein
MRAKEEPMAYLLEKMQKAPAKAVPKSLTADEYRIGNTPGGFFTNSDYRKAAVNPQYPKSAAGLTNVKGGWGGLGAVPATQRTSTVVSQAGDPRWKPGMPMVAASNFSAGQGQSPTLTTPGAQFDSKGISLVNPNAFSTVRTPFVGDMPTVDWTYQNYGNIPQIQSNAITVGDINATGDFGLPAQVAAIKQRIDADTVARVQAARENEVARGMGRSGVAVAVETAESREGDILKAQTEGDAAAKAGELRATAAIEQARNRVSIAEANQNASVQAAAQARQAEAVRNELESKAAISRGELKMQFMEAANKYRALADSLNLESQKANQTAQSAMMEANRLYAQHRESLDLTRQVEQGGLGYDYASLAENARQANQRSSIDRITAEANAAGTNTGMTYDQRRALAEYNQGMQTGRTLITTAGTLASKAPWFNMENGQTYADEWVRSYQKLYGSLPPNLVQAPSTQVGGSSPQLAGASVGNVPALNSSASPAVTADVGAIVGTNNGIYRWPDGTTSQIVP